jgi:Ecdysteroid kinase-like family
MTTGDALVRGAMVAAYDDCWEPCKERFGYLLTPGLVEHGPGLGKRILAQLDLFASRPLTLAHGDYRLDNMFFSRAGSDRPVIVCDWQSPSRSWAAYDLAYFLAGSLEPADRAKHEWNLAREYHERLLARGVTGYSWEMLREDYLACLGVMMGIFVINGATLPTTNDRAIQVFDKMIGRFVAAIDDLNVLDHLPKV